MSAPAKTIGNNTKNNINMATPQFPAALFNQLAALHPSDNIIISPLLLEAALALLFLGSDGATAEQLKTLLQLKRFGSNAKMANYYADVLETFSKAEDTKMHTLQRILLADGVAISDEFQKIALKYFHTSAENAPVANKASLLLHINNVLRKYLPFDKMSQNNKEIALETLSSESRALLLSMVCFQSKWFLPFSAYRSGTYDFHNSAEVQLAVPMMFDDDMFVKFAEFKELDARAIELPYEHEEELAMLLVLPNSRDGLVELEQRLCGVDLCDLAERMQMESVQVLLPKFRINFETSLRNALETLGISTLFTNEANFSNLLKENSKEALPFSDVLQNVCIEVNESGSEAASVAGTKPIVISNCINARQRFFRADHPFYFAIRSRDVLLFAGHVTKF